MSKYFSLFLLALVFLSASCDDKEEDPTEQTVKFNLNLEVDGDPIGLNEEFVNVSNYRVLFSDMKFYLSNIRLLKTDGTYHDLSDIEFFTATDNQLSQSYIVPVGLYEGVEYSWGVPAELDSPDDPDFDISIYPAGHPLNEDNGMYWSWAAGYRYMVIDGRYDTDANSTDPLIETFSYHPGRQILYRTVTVEQELNYDGEVTRNININLDMNKIFSNGTEVIDPAEPLENGLGGGNASTFGPEFMEVFMDAFETSLN